MRNLNRLWALVAALALALHASAALAAPPTPADDDLRFTYTGTLSAQADGALTLTLEDGQQLTFKLAEGARIAWPGRRGAAAADVAPGANVRVTVERADPQAAWQVVRVRVLDRALSAPQADAPTVPSVAGVAQAYAAGSTLAVRQPDGGLATYQLSAATRLLPAGHAQPPAAGDRVLLLFKRGDASQVWAIVVLPNTRAAQGQ